MSEASQSEPEEQSLSCDLCGRLIKLLGVIPTTTTLPQSETGPLKAGFRQSEETGTVRHGTPASLGAPRQQVESAKFVSESNAAAESNAETMLFASVECS